MTLAMSYNLERNRGSTWQRPNNESPSGTGLSACYPHRPRDKRSTSRPAVQKGGAGRMTPHPIAVVYRPMRTRGTNNPGRVARWRASPSAFLVSHDRCTVVAAVSAYVTTLLWPYVHAYRVYRRRFCSTNGDLLSTYNASWYYKAL